MNHSYLAWTMKEIILDFYGLRGPVIDAWKTNSKTSVVFAPPIVQFPCGRWLLHLIKSSQHCEIQILNPSLLLEKLRFRYLGFLIIKMIYYLKLLWTERERELFWPLVHFPYGHNGGLWARLVLGVRSFLKVSSAGSRACLFLLFSGHQQITR